MNKKLFTTLLSLITFCLGISAQADEKNHGQLALGVEASTAGAGLELAAKLNPNFALRGGVSFLPAYSYDAVFKVNMSESFKKKINDYIETYDLTSALSQQGLPTRAEDINTDVNTTSTLDFINGKILLDYYPWAKYAFHITGGIYVGKSDIIKIKGKMDQAIEILELLKQSGFDYSNETIISDVDYQLTGKDIADMKGNLKVNSVKPYLGIGFGRAVPKSRIGVSFEIGAFYQGNPKLVSDNNNIQKLIDAKLSEVSDVVDAVKKIPVYPVISLKLNFRLF